MSEVLVLAARPAQRLAFSGRTLVRACPEPVRVALALLLMLGLSVAIIAVPFDYKALGNYGYLGVFLITLLASASLVLPVPYLGVVIVAGSFLNPVLVALVAGLAAALGELTGYILGRSGRTLLPEHRWVARLEQGMSRFGSPVILVAAVVPNPFFDAVGLIAGATRLPLLAFLLPCFIGKTLRLWLVASLGGWLPG